MAMAAGFAALLLAAPASADDHHRGHGYHHNWNHRHYHRPYAAYPNGSG